jgi:cation transport regulator ChaC
MWYFAYGSTMAGGAMEQVLGHPLEGRPALLRGFRLAFTAFGHEWQGGVADLVRDEAAEVEGVLFDLTAADLLRIDFNEGMSEGIYRRRAVEVELETGQEVQAVAHEVVDKQPHVPPSATYLDAMVSGATEQGLSERYVNWLLELYPDVPTPHRPAWDDDE